MRLPRLTSAIAFLPLLCISCAQKAEYYGEAPALEAMRRAAAEAPADPAAQPEPAILLTVFLKHDQSKTLDDISRHLDSTGFWSTFPPEGVEIESWKIVMGIGQVVTLRVPPAKLRDVNRTLEATAWGAYRTEFYPTYDFMQIAQERRAKATSPNK